MTSVQNHFYFGLVYILENSNFWETSTFQSKKPIISQSLPTVISPFMQDTLTALFTVP